MEYLFSQILNGLSLGCIYALVALGFAMVYGVLKLLNFAHSEVFTAGAFAGYFVLRAVVPIMEDWPLLAVLIALLVAGICAATLALFVERIAYRPLRALPKVSVLLAAIGMSILLQSMGIKFLGANTRAYPVLNLPVSPKIYAVFVLLGTFMVLYQIIYHSKIGIKMRAVSEDPETAQLMGIDPERVIMFTFLLGGFFAGIGGVVWGILYGSINPMMGFYPGLKAFIIAVIGSIGSLMGTFVMGIALGLVESLSAAYLPDSLSSFRDPLVFSVLILVLLTKPSGLFGKSVPEKI